MKEENLKNIYSINYLKKKLGVSSQTIRNYIKQGKIEATRMPNGRFYFTEKQIQNFLAQSQFVNKKNVDENLDNFTSWAFYIRSSEGNKTHLDNQEKALRDNYPDPKFVFKDSSSGLNENRQGLKKLIQKAKEGEITHIAITQKDRLSRFGNDYLTELFTALGVTLHVLYEDVPSFEKIKKNNMYQELMKDFMSLITSFSGKMYQLHSLENKIKLLDEAKNNLIKP